MAVTRYTANPKLREDGIGPITPKWSRSENIVAPPGNWRPARWLPVQFTKSQMDQGTDAFVISSGKVVALDGEGMVVPAGMVDALKSGLSYTATDVTYGVIDLVTGAAVTGAVTYTALQVAEAIAERGLVSAEAILAEAGAAVPPTTQTHREIIIDLFISAPIGVAPYDIFVWSGLPEEGDQVFTNYSKQSGIAFWTEMVMEVPHLVATAVTGDAFDGAVLVTSTAAAGDAVQAGELWNATNLAALTRYSLMGVTATSDVVALGLTGGRVAKNTTRTPVACDTTGVLVRERSSIADIKVEGDWYLDADVGVLVLHSDTWTTIGASTVAFDYFQYAQGAATAHRHVHFDDVGRPGQLLTFDAQSNFRVASAAEIAAGARIVGQLLKVVRHPRTALDKVKTAWSYESMSATSKMPGSASAGYPDLITFSGETVADETVIIKLRV